MNYPLRQQNHQKIISLRENSCETPTIIRQLNSGEANKQREYFEGLTKQSRYLRFLSPINQLPQYMINKLSQLDDDNHIAICVEAVSVSEHKQTNTMIAEARLVRCQDNAQDYEIAISVSESWQGLGIGAELLNRLEQIAVTKNTRNLFADTLHENTPMIGLAKSAGYSSKLHPEDSHLLQLCKKLNQNTGRSSTSELNQNTINPLVGAKSAA